MGDNKEQAELWNGRMGQSWVKVESYIDRMLAPISDYAIDSMAAARGERIVDIGCGCGTTSLALAAAGAAVWGVDISSTMIAQAKRKETGSADVHFSVGDAARQDYTPDHDGVFSRFGCMFFDDPVAAFTNIRSALQPGGRARFVVWQSPADNPWIALPGAAVQPFQPEDMPFPDPDSPGPFSLADPEKARQTLVQAGFEDVMVEPVNRTISLGQDIDEVMAFQMHIGPLSAVLETLEENRREEAIQAVRDAIAPHATADGVSFDAAAWLLSARNHK